MQRVAALEDSLAGQEDLNNSLTRQLDETRQQEDKDADLSGRLADAEQLLGHLRDELKVKEEKAKVTFDFLIN